MVTMLMSVADDFLAKRMIGRPKRLIISLKKLSRKAKITIVNDETGIHAVLVWFIPRYINRVFYFISFHSGMIDDEKDFFA